MLLLCSLEPTNLLFCGPEHLYLDAIFQTCLGESSVVVRGFLALPEELLVGGWDEGDVMQSCLEVGEGGVWVEIERIGLPAEGDCEGDRGHCAHVIEDSAVDADKVPKGARK